MIDRLEAHQGHRATISTVDQGNVTGTLGPISYLVEGDPVSVELRDPDELDVGWIVIPWSSVVGIHPEENGGISNPFDPTQEAPRAPDPES